MRQIFLKAAIVTMLIQSFVVSNVTKGLLLQYLLILIHVSSDSMSALAGMLRINIFRPLALFVIVFLTLQLLIQFLNSIYTPDFYGLVMVSSEPSNVSLFRKSLFTQSIYLLTSVIFFLYMLKWLSLKELSKQVHKLTKIGLIIFVGYGFYEFVGYLVFGTSIDFLSNRITGEDFQYGLFQTLNIGGLIIMRMKSLAGEPSMFAYSLLPFFTLYYYQRERICFFILAALLLSTSTTAFIGLLLFILLDTLLFKKSIKLLSVVAGGLLLVTYLFRDIIVDVYEFTFSKFALEHNSGLMRFGFFKDTINYWADSDMFHILFGYGFGYVRSTDGISTLLFNTGLVGTIAFLLFFLYPVIKTESNSGYRKGIHSGIIISIVTILVSVSEFYYLHIWLFAAMAWAEYFKSIRNRV